MKLVPRALLGLLALLLGNAYIVGINQIYDVDIDKASSGLEARRPLFSSRTFRRIVCSAQPSGRA